MAKEKKEKTAAKAQNDKNEAQEKLEALEKEVAELKEKLAKEKDDYMRLMAEFETFRRRTAEEKLALVGSAATDTIKGMLPVLDDLERAMEMLSGSSDEAAKEGTTLIYDKLFAYLKGKGLEVIEAAFRYRSARSRVPVPRHGRGGQGQGVRRGPDRLQTGRQGHPLRQSSCRSVSYGTEKRLLRGPGRRQRRLGR